MVFVEARERSAGSAGEADVGGGRVAAACLAGRRKSLGGGEEDVGILHFLENL